MCTGLTSSELENEKEIPHADERILSEQMSIVSKFNDSWIYPKNIW